MKFSIKKTDILDVLSKVQGMAGRKSSLAITETVLINAKGNTITLAATDLETGFTGTYAAVVETEGVIALNARKLYEIVREFPTDDVIVNEVENRWIEIGDSKVLYHIVGMNPDDFPDVPTVPQAAFINIDSFMLKRMIERNIMVAGPSDDKRAHILGTYFQIITADGTPKARMTSTDGSRLMLMDTPFGGEAIIGLEEGILIPKKGLHEINKFLGSEGEVRVGIQDNHFVVKKQRETLIVRLLEGAFPAYEEIIKKEDGHIISVAKQPFLMMLKRMSILSSEDYKAAIFKFENNSLLISASNPDIGESKEDMAIDYDGECMTIAFNPRFFIDTLNVTDSDEAIIYLVSEEKPCLLFDKEDDSFLSAIMPMRI